jgi:U4/U6 small nuclear ribonucleoprotein PRP31
LFYFLYEMNHRPDLTVKKRRGGRKMRQLKERFEETALMKQANTRAFSAQTGEYGDDAMGLTMGLLDTAQQEGGGGSGNVRKQVVEKRKMRQTNTKATRKRAAQMARYSSATAGAGTAGAAASTATSGLASTIAFTPMQAMELVNPDAQKDRVRQANLKWFSDNAGFQSAVPPKK